MWKRNLLFLVVCAAGLALPIIRLAPRSTATPILVTTAAAPVVVDKDFELAVGSLSYDSQNAGIPADTLIILRRTKLALQGTIPSLEEIRAVERGANRDGLEFQLRHVFAILQERRTADYLAERLARAFVGVEDGPFLLYRRRKFVSWLSDQIYANRPYDEIVRHLVADEGLWTDSPAVNYLTVAVKPMESPDPDPNVLAARTARAMLGVRIDCAECHDHPFDKWKQSDFEGLAAFFATAKNKKLQGLRDQPRPYVVEDAKIGAKRTVAPCVPFEQQLFVEARRSREALARWITHPDNQAFARATANRAWAILFGKPLIEPIDDVRWNENDASLEFERYVIDFLADDFVRHRYDFRRLLALIANSHAFTRESRSFSDGAKAWTTFPLVRLRPEQVIGAILQATSVTTIDPERDVTMRFLQFVTQQDFVKRYGDAGDDEFNEHPGTIPQRLLMMNGRLIREKLRDPLIFNAAARIGTVASTPEAMIEAAYLAVLTRRPTSDELRHFVDRYDDPPKRTDAQFVEDLYWTLLNSTEFAWNH